jgi:kynurenine formamidase
VIASVPTEQEVLGYFSELSNWTRWGADDELGTLNLISPEKRQQAASLVRDGISIGCARPIIAGAPAPDVHNPPLLHMLQSGESRPPVWAIDWIGMVFHGTTISHIDTLGHAFWNGRLYNGRSSELITTQHGSSVCSVETMKDGIVTRGVLLDITRLRGKRYLDPGEPVLVEDLEAAERSQGVEIGEGDALLLRTGWSLRREEEGPETTGERPGLHAATLPWLHRRGVAVIAADASQDVVPSGYTNVARPVHSVGLVAMGLCMLDACQFEDLVRECEARGRWECMFIVAPLRFRNATGSPTTPLAVM